jgi:hypothetical protein
MMFLRRVFPTASAAGLALAASLVFSNVILGAPASETALSVAKVRAGTRTFTFRDGGSACFKGSRTGRYAVDIGSNIHYFALTVLGRAKPGRYRIPGEHVFGDNAPIWRRAGEDGTRRIWGLVRGTLTVAPGLKHGTFSGRAFEVTGGPTILASGSWSCARVVLVAD